MVLYKLHPRYSSLDDLIAKFGEPLRLDLGCGYYKPNGFIGLDNGTGFGAQIANEDNAPDILMNLNSEALPFKDNTCIEVRASHFIEHCVIDHILNEVHRVLRPDGTFRMIIPYANSAEGMYPGHSIFLTEKWFKRNINFMKKFTIVEETYIRGDEYKRLPWYFRALLPFDIARTFLFNACKEMHLVCAVRK